LVVEDLLRDHDEGQNLQFILCKLYRVPKELEDLFTEMLQGVKERHLTFRLFQWAILSTAPLRLREWHHILAFTQEEPPLSLDSWSKSDTYTKDDEQLLRRLMTLSKGFLEVKATPVETEEDGTEMSVRAGAGSLDFENGETRTVHVIHQSVRDFFLHHRGFSFLDPENADKFKTADAVVPAGHLAIMHTCLDYVKIKELDALVGARERAEEISRQAVNGAAYPGLHHRRRSSCDSSGSLVSFSSAASYDSTASWRKISKQQTSPWKTKQDPDIDKSSAPQ
jgi:protein SERAC1